MTYSVSERPRRGKRIWSSGHDSVSHTVTIRARSWACALPLVRGARSNCSTRCTIILIRKRRAGHAFYTCTVSQRTAIGTFTISWWTGSLCHALELPFLWLKCAIAGLLAPRARVFLCCRCCIPVAVFARNTHVTSHTQES